MAVSYLYSYRHVVLLSANRRGDPKGLRSILRNEVAPALREQRPDGLALTLLLQIPGTTVKGFAGRILRTLRAWEFVPGFREIRL
jgi:hypothetical protein